MYFMIIVFTNNERLDCKFDSCAFKIMFNLYLDDIMMLITMLVQQRIPVQT